MGRSQESFGKKERRKKKERKKREKEEKRLAKKEEGKSSLDDMIAYVDEYGNITDTPPDPTDKEEVDAEDIVIGVPKREDIEFDPIRKGIVKFYNDEKGYGFIDDIETKESIFVHVSNLEEDITEGNKVTFEVEKGLKGPAAVRVKVDRG